MPLHLPKVRSDLEFFDREVEGEDVVVVHDPVRGTYYKYNLLQAAMLRKLDGVRSLDDMVAALSDEFEVEIPRQAAERFVANARERMLLDIASYNVSEKQAQKKVLKALARNGFQFRGLAEPANTGLSQRVASAEAVLFMGGIRHLQAGHPGSALDYFCAVLEINPKNKRAQTLVDVIQTAYVKALSGSTTDFPTLGVFDPTRILRFLDRTLGKLIFHWTAWFALFALVGLAAYCASITTYPEVDLGTIDIIVVYLVLMLHAFIHEVGHGLACYHYGGKVPEIGFTRFYYVAPFPYCDTSSSYLFKTRAHKVAVQLAGAVASLIFLCLSAILLSVIHPDAFIYTGWQINLYITGFMLVANLIPLLKFDGYYALCDLLGTPNLRERSFKLAKTWVGARLLGLPGTEEALEQRKRKYFIGFALASMLFTVWWIYQLVFKLAAPVVERFQGIGLVLSVVTVGYLLRRTLFWPFATLLRLVIRERRRIFTLKRGAALLLLLSMTCAPWMLPWPIIVDSEFILVPKQRSEVRVQTGGSIDQVLVQEGDFVKRGQPLATLRNVDLELELRVVQAELEGVDAHLRRLYAGARPEELELAKRQVRTMQASAWKDSREAKRANTLASQGMGTRLRANSATGSASVNQSLASAAAWRLASIEAGSRVEVIAAAEAERARLVAQRDQVQGDRELLTIRSPIDGVVATKHLHDRRYEWLKRGDTFAEIHDVSSFVAEIHLPASSPLDELEIGDKIVLRAEGAPGDEIACRIERIRKPGDADDSKAKSDSKPNRESKAKSDLIVVTTAFAMPVGRSGMAGHARLYGRERSLAYAKLYLPLERVVQVSLWALL